ncbi:MAG: MBOAT family protein [Lachnospiraceae bacterium]|nr:MBOAT family protein [Lachnospiraceae bacterium]
MVFADLFFLYAFLPLCLIFYFACSKLPYRNAVLIVFSLIFYAWGEPKVVFLLLLSTVVNWLFGLVIDKHRNDPIGKVAVGGSLVFSLGMLVVFKYLGFIVENLNMILPFELSVPNITLPIGISFYTFQIISYILDCYWDQVKVQKNYFKFLLYVSLFPQLIAGPIVRYSVVEKEISNRKTTVTDLSEGACRFMIGLAKKVLLANNLWVIVENFFGGDISGLSVLGTWYTVIVYAMYVYFDFSGYSDMAIGLGRIFGFHFDENFKHPFICRNIAEFWQRWHISLGSFFRDYLLYVSIGGKRRVYLNLFLVWFSTGLWHGASWNYILWGLYFGVFILIEQLIGKKRMKAIPTVLTHIYSKIVIIIGFGIFYFEDFKQLGNFFKNLVGANGNALTDTLTLTSAVNNCFLLAVAIIACFPIGVVIKKVFEKSNKTVAAGQLLKTAYCLGLLVVCSLLLVDATSNPFLYFRF